MNPACLKESASPVNLISLFVIFSLRAGATHTAARGRWLKFQSSDCIWENLQVDFSLFLTLVFLLLVQLLSTPQRCKLARQDSAGKSSITKSCWTFYRKYSFMSIFIPLAFFIGTQAVLYFVPPYAKLRILIFFRLRFFTFSRSFFLLFFLMLAAGHYNHSSTCFFTFSL